MGYPRLPDSAGKVRLPPMNTTLTLSEAAVALLRDYRGDIVTEDSNREACRELAAAGYLIGGHTFTGGREVFYRMTQAGVDLSVENAWM
jgi:hypothetical protein